LSNCTSCHKEAEKGIFDDDTVLIPGYGRWDDD
ncbi:MAG: cytochrome C, partial [Deltaproteobacteria bacterium]|nr:cytochrome C [Deltaproteobacteria bacterium]